MSGKKPPNILPIKLTTMLSCNHKNLKNLYSTNGYSIVQCGNCGFRKSFPMSVQENIAKIQGDLELLVNFIFTTVNTAKLFIMWLESNKSFVKSFGLIKIPC